jgi:predicted site-specific integrase-resolvase
MKKLFIYIIFFSLSIHYGFCQNVEKIDSLFNHHIKSISDTINKYEISNDVKIYTYNDDITFLYVLSDISDFKFEQHGYTHQPMLNKEELLNIKKWYKKYRKELNWCKIYNLFKIYKEYNNAYKVINSEDPSSYKSYELMLDSLDVEHKRLINTNTFIKRSDKVKK